MYVSIPLCECICTYMCTCKADVGSSLPFSTFRHLLRWIHTLTIQLWLTSLLLVSLSLGAMLLSAWGWLIWGEGVIEGIRCDVKSHGLSSSREVSALRERHSGWSSHGLAPGTHFCHTLCPARNHSGWKLAVTIRGNSWVSLHISHQQQSPVLSMAHRSLPCTSNPLATFGKGDISHVHVVPKLCGSLMEGIDSVPIMGPWGRVVPHLSLSILLVYGY